MPAGRRGVNGLLTIEPAAFLHLQWPAGAAAGELGDKQTGSFMKKFALALAAATLLASSANAADLPVRGPVYKAAPLAPAPMTWTGCYVGAGGGYGMYNQEVTDGFGTSSSSPTTFGGRGWFGTAQVGCDYQVASSWVIGVFGDYDFSDLKGKFDGTEEKLRWSWAAGGRVGYVVLPNLLTYVSGGYTEANFRINDFDFNHTFKGWFLGTGYEYGLTMLSPSLFWKTEYRYASYRRDTFDIPGVEDGVEANKYVQTIRSELVWRFNFGHF
jgi:outer membrane immunogenic protein